MRQNRIYITGILLLFAFLSGRAQQPRIDELECRNLKIGYEKTLHMIFPTPVKYLNMGDENIIGEVIQVCPSVIRLKFFLSAPLPERFGQPFLPLCQAAHCSGLRSFSLL